MPTSSEETIVRHLFPVLLFSAATTASAQMQLGPNEIPANDNRLAVGVGYNSLTGEVKNFKCADVKLEKDVNDDARGIQHVNADKGNSYEQLFKSDTTRARASFGYGGFSASVGYSAMRSSTVSSYSEFLRIEGRLKFYRDIGFKNGIKILVSNDREFYNKCGDSFIIGVIYGQDFLATYRSEATTLEEANTVAVALDAAYSGMSGGASVGWSNEQRQKFNSGSSRIKFEVTNSKLDALPKFTPEDFIEYARTFASKADKKNAYPVAFIYASYDGLFPPDPPELDAEARYIRALYQRRSDLKYVLAYPASFGPFNVSKAQTELNAIEKAIEERTTMVAGCLDNQQQKVQEALALRDTKQRVNSLTLATGVDNNCQAVYENLAKSRLPLRSPVGRIQEVPITKAMVQSNELWPIYRAQIDEYPVVVEMRGVYNLEGANVPDDQPLPGNWVINPGRGCLSNPPNNINCLGTRWILQEFGTANTGTYIDSRAFTIPPKHTLFFQVFDTGYADNTVGRASNQPRIAYWYPLYPEDAPTPLGANEAVPSTPVQPKPPAARQPPPPHEGCGPSGRNPCSFPPLSLESAAKLAESRESSSGSGTFTPRLDGSIVLEPRPGL